MNKKELDEIWQLWFSGHDTMDISTRLRIPESDIERVINRLIDEEFRKDQGCKDGQ